MLQRIKFGLKVLLIIIMGGFFHYVLPQHDVVRVTSTEIIRQDFSWYNRMFYAQADSGNVEGTNRDMRLINTVRRKTWIWGFFRRESEEVMVYRNEDTGWIWPPYFKFDSSNLQAESAALAASGGQEQWAVITHYGWRNKLLTVFPNAVSIKPVAGPDVRVIPWFNVFFFSFLIIGWLFLRAAWRQFRERNLDPTLNAIDEHVDAAQDRAQGVWGRFMAWINTWRGKPRV
ncbi:DUF1523 family protein [Halocynthiibacter styelae]|uniref:DUF1523 family protein n=1 Tax=Halocynthiibacter styelae TaxID=2761955 RepID=A0A8J7IEE0_9RHOB|nr:DUF1523 family protein [Paenihalocynthiibacter styelae]MBI1494669.1 DUF1523 family protein [Paenihalocynthiibacter styelae]